MPGRKIPLITNQVYHVFNKGINNQITFSNNKEYNRAKLTIFFYQFLNPPLRLSYFLEKSKDEKRRIIKSLKKEGNVLVFFYCYCFMSNHFHFLIEQRVDNGISKFMSQYQNSYTRYYNTKHKRIGSLFLDQFKAKRIETDEQLLHVSRYIHLNPYTSYEVKSLKSLQNYPASSFSDYFNNKQNLFCKTEKILSFFKNKNRYKDFVFDQANYQRELDKIKRLLF